MSEYVRRDARGRWLPLSHVSRRELSRASAEARDVRIADRRARVRALWSTMSIRDMASELDAPVSGIQNDARLLGLPPRPVSVQP